MRELDEGQDYYRPVAGRFRPGQASSAEADVLLALSRREDSWLDIGAGGGRFALPLAGRVRRVIAVEPSPAMRQVLDEGARAAGATNLSVHDARWPVPALVGGGRRRARRRTASTTSASRSPSSRRWSTPPGASAWWRSRGDRADRSLADLFRAVHGGTARRAPGAPGVRGAPRGAGTPLRGQARRGRLGRGAGRGRGGPRARAPHALAGRRLGEGPHDVRADGGVVGGRPAASGSPWGSGRSGSSPGSPVTRRPTGIPAGSGALPALAVGWGPGPTGPARAAAGSGDPGRARGRAGGAAGEQRATAETQAAAAARLRAGGGRSSSRASWATCSATSASSTSAGSS